MNHLPSIVVKKNETFFMIFTQFDKVFWRKFRLGGVASGDFHFLKFFPESSSLSLWGWRGETWRSKQKLCRFVIRKNVACFSCTNSKRTFFLKILKRFLGFFGIFVTAIFEGFSVGFGSLRNKRIFAVFAPSGLSKKGRWPLMQRLREFV